ncbi:MAG TPA: Uma2 family endonuclease [Anaerolineae bacterium]|nr:Uma2 family endonuclease [Anaerolineae bacterium]
MFVQTERRLFTTEEYHQMAETGILAEDDRTELIRGEVVAMSPIGVRHAACVKRITELLTFHFRNKAIVSIQDPLRLDEMTEVQPDAALLRYRDDYYVQATPTGEDVLLLIEVSDSTLAYDRVIKLPLYARAQIPEVWLVNLVDNLLEVYRAPQGDEYTEFRRVYRKDTAVPLAFPNIPLPVNDIIP